MRKLEADQECIKQDDSIEVRVVLDVRRSDQMQVEVPTYHSLLDSEMAGAVEEKAYAKREVSTPTA